MMRRRSAATPSRPRHRGARSTGFTLLEVMIATSILAVGTVSVLAIFASAVGFANRRQAQAELAQVLEEARSEARSAVDAFRPAAAISGARPANPKAPVSAARLPGGDSGKIPEKTSRLFEGYRYDLAFEELARGVPEAGFRTTITVRWGDQQSYSESLTLLPTSIPDGEFEYSSTFQEEEQDRADGKARESR